MPGRDGLTAAAELHEALPHCRIVVCTTFGRPGYLARAMAAGVAGFVVKDAPPEQLVDAVRRVHSGLRVVDPALAAESLAAGQNPLTERERDVLRVAGEGGTIADVAKALHLSGGTVRNHLSSAMGKTGARTRARRPSSPMSAAGSEKGECVRFVRRLVLGVLIIGGLVVGGTGFRVWQVARVDDRARADVVIVLGAAQYDGKPSKILEARLNHARSLYQDGVADHIVTGGGRQAGDTYTEADAGARWLTSHGVPRDRVIEVDEGTDTLGTLRAVAGAVKARGWRSAVIVSDPWHSLRARTMADDLGLEAWTSPTHSGPIVQTRQTQLRYILRETGALLYYRATKAPADGIGINEDVTAGK